jgi:hypothetical protein
MESALELPKRLGRRGEHPRRNVNNPGTFRCCVHATHSSLWSVAAALPPPQQAEQTNAITPDPRGSGAAKIATERGRRPTLAGKDPELG